MSSVISNIWQKLLVHALNIYYFECIKDDYCATWIITNMSIQFIINPSFIVFICKLLITSYDLLSSILWLHFKFWFWFLVMPLIWKQISSQTCEEVPELFLMPPVHFSSEVAIQSQILLIILKFLECIFYIKIRNKCRIKNQFPSAHCVCEMHYAINSPGEFRKMQWSLVLYRSW